MKPTMFTLTGIEVALLMAVYIIVCVAAIALTIAKCDPERHKLLGDIASYVITACFVALTGHAGYHLLT